MNNNYLYHHGILGQKWGVRRYQNKDGSYTAEGKKHAGYKSTSIKSAIARRQNEKVDDGFKKWKENSNKKTDAIDLGKHANIAKRAYENDKNNKTLKSEYKQANKEYKKALKGNTTYRKGQIKQEVGSDLSRKYLSDAKKIKKQLDIDPTNKELQKRYNDLMSKHDVERAKARRAPEVAANRSRKIASLKRAATMTVKAAATTAALSTGALVVNKYLSGHEFTINGSPMSINSEQIRKAADIGKKIIGYGKYVY